MSTATPGRLLGGRLVVLGLGEGASRLFGFLAMSYLFRKLDPAGYGHVETTIAVVMFCTIGVEFGLNVVGTREVARQPELAASLLRRVASAQLLVAVAAFVLLAAVAMLLPIDPLLRRLLIGFGIGLFGVPFSIHWIFQGRNQMLAVAATKTARSAVFLVACVLLVRAPEDVTRLPYVEVAGIAAMCAACVAVWRRGGERLDFGFGGKIDRALCREALSIAGSCLIWALRVYLAVVVVGAVAGPEAAGRYGAAQRIVMVFVGMIEVYFINVFPQISAAAIVSRHDLRRLLVRSMHVLVWPSLVAAALMTWTAPWLMRTIYGAEHTVPESAALLAAICWLVPVLALRFHGRYVLFSVNRQHAEFVCSLVGVGALVVLLRVLGSTYGALGAAWAVVTAEILTTILVWALVAPQIRDLPRADGSSRGGFSGSDGGTMLETSPADDRGAVPPTGTR